MDASTICAGAPQKQAFSTRAYLSISNAVQVSSAIAQFGLEAVDCGTVPTPALAYHAMAAGCGAIMVTGSHVAADRNGLKFYLPSGEISKADETDILAALGDEPILGNRAMLPLPKYFLPRME